jgi:hypothetical protein
MKIAVQQTTVKSGVVELKDHMYTRDAKGDVVVLQGYEFLVTHALRTGNQHEKRIVEEVFSNEDNL